MLGGRDSRPTVGTASVRRLVLAVVSVVALVAAGLAAAPGAQAADPNPTPLACTTAAVQQAAAAGGAYVFNCTDTIYAPLDVNSQGQPFVVPSGVQVSLARPAGAQTLEFVGRASRIFEVAAGGTLRLENVTMYGGLSGEDDLHGVSSYPVSEQASNGADGANIGSNGVTGTPNSAGTGGNGADGDSGKDGRHGGDGAGGAIYNQGTLVMDEVRFIENTAEAGPGGDGGNGQHGGSGGAGSTASGGNGGAGGSGGAPGGPGGSAAGGAIYNAAGALLWGHDINFAEDSAFGGHGGSGGNGSFGGNGGHGGAAQGSPCPADGGNGGNSGAGPSGTNGGTALGGDIYNAGTAYLGGDTSFGLASAKGGYGGTSGSIWAAGVGTGVGYVVDTSTCPGWSAGATGQLASVGDGANGGDAAGGSIYNAAGGTLTLAGTPDFNFSGSIDIAGGDGGNGGNATNSDGGNGGDGGDGGSGNGLAVANAASTAVSISTGVLCEYSGNTSCGVAAYACYASHAGGGGGGGRDGGVDGAPGTAGNDCGDYMTGSTASIAPTVSQDSPWPDAWFTEGGTSPVVLPGTPSVTGTAKVGDTLIAHTGTWLASSTLSYGYVWKASGTVIAGQSKPTLRLAAAQLGKKISVTVTGSVTGASQSATSTVTATVGKGALTTVIPKITGTAKVGHKLKAAHGSWKPSGVTFSYRWFASGKKIAGATKSSLALKQAQAAKLITVKVAGGLPGYASASRTSKATAKVRS